MPNAETKTEETVAEAVDAEVEDAAEVADEQDFFTDDDLPPTRGETFAEKWESEQAEAEAKESTASSTEQGETGQTVTVPLGASGTQAAQSKELAVQAQPVLPPPVSRPPETPPAQMLPGWAPPGWKPLDLSAIKLDEYDADYASAIKREAARDEVLAALLKREAQREQQEQIRSVVQEEAEFDTHVNAFGSDWNDVFGSGSGVELLAKKGSEKQYQNRLGLYAEMRRQAVAHPEMGRKDLIDLAHRALHGPEIVKREVAKAQRQAQERERDEQGRFTNRPAASESRQELSRQQRRQAAIKDAAEKAGAPI